MLEDREAYLSLEELESRIEEIQAQMRQAAANLDFERAATLRDKIKTLEGARARARCRRSVVSELMC